MVVAFVCWCGGLRVVEEVAEVHKTGRPILIGTTDVAKSLELSKLLKKKKVPHELLNALPEHAAREVLATKGSPRQYDGQYLLGQSLYGQKQYSNAAIAYDDAYKYSPKGIHAQDALLGLANALVAIGEKNAACGTIRKLRNEFPQPRPEVRDGAAARTKTTWVSPSTQPTGNGAGRRIYAVMPPMTTARRWAS